MSPSFLKLFAATSLVAASLTGAAPLDQLQERSAKNHTQTKSKVILDNDWGVAGFIPYLMALDAGWEVLGLVSDTANSWAEQCGLHALATLEVGNLSCIPVHKGADYPILNTPELFQTWEMVHGKLAWEGAFAPENLTNEALGNDPTSGDPSRVSKAALYEGYPNTTYASKDAAWFMIQQVRKYPGQVSIYSAGALTNIALAIRMDPDFAKNAKELVVMGGYIDGNLLQVTGSVMQADWNSDINLMIDPEGTKIALTAPFPNITIAGNVANQVSVTQEYLDDIYKVKNPYSSLMHKYYGTIFPLWDETAAAIMLDPTIIKNTTSFYLDVDTAPSSPTYGNIHAYQEALKPVAQKLQKVNMVVSIDGNRLKKWVKRAVQYPKTCADL
ncbi:nucleoside hydrolase [Aureobasidium subglaciale]|nr:nucleoside hydrolase [Aureobasidium subglaciale]